MLMDLALDNPFLPGTGRLPPVRAGHETAARTLKLSLRRAVERKQGDIVVLFGPRGNGKTTLMAELVRSVPTGDALVRTLEAEKTDRPIHEVAEYLVRGDVLPEGEMRKVAVSVLQTGGELELGETPKYGLMEALVSQLEGKPMLLCVDEAHEMCPKFGKYLLQAAQSCIWKGLPLLLVLAGTPLIKSHLSSMGATFWERSTRLPIGRLESDDEVRKALAQPAKDAGLPFEVDALELLVAESQRYPYFIQILGHQSWVAATVADEKTTSIAIEDAKRGVQTAEVTRDAFYAGRRAEMQKQKVLAHAEAVSKAMVDRGVDGKLQEAELEELLEMTSAGSELSPVVAKERLEHAGLIWCETDGVWEPGIPSLCAYIARKIRTAAG